MAITDPTSTGAARLRNLLAIAESEPPTPSDHSAMLARHPRLREVSHHSVEFAGPRGSVRGRLYPVPGATNGLVWVHGGAFIAGDLDMDEAHWFALELAARGIAVLTLDYRKAVSGIHSPVPSDDVLAGWSRAAEDDLLGVGLAGMHIGGASAGASLSASITARLIAGGGPRPQSLTLVYPIVHAIVPAPSPEAAEAACDLPADLRCDSEFMRAISINYVGSPDRLDDPIAFPANANIRGFPRTYILNAEADDLRPSGEAFAAQLSAAEVTAVLNVEPGTRHGYLNDHELPQATLTIDRIATWLRGRGTTDLQNGSSRSDRAHAKNRTGECFHER